MAHSDSDTKWALYLFLIGLICASTSFTSLKSQYGPIMLHDEPLTFKPHKFYISDVADERVNRNVTAILLGKDNNPPVRIDLKDGAVHAIKNFLDHNLHRDTALRPVLLTIKEFQLNETRIPNGLVRGDLKIVFSFSSQLSYQNKHLVDFNGKVSYKRSENSALNVEACLRQGITNGLTYFNNWIETQRSLK